jgi:MFS family permease
VKETTATTVGQGGSFHGVSPERRSRRHVLPSFPSKVPPTLPRVASATVEPGGRRSLTVVEGALDDDARSARGRTRDPLALYRWSDPSLLALGLLALFAGFGQFGAVAALGDVAKTFGHVSGGATFADEVGLSGTILGVGLAVIRAASFLGLPLASLADRVGRRPMLLGTCAVGLGLTVLAVVSPSYWWFVVIFAVGRPFLSATVGLTQVGAVELTSTSQRAKAVSLVAAGYAVGAGLTAIIHSLAERTLGFRGIFALAIVPMVLLPVVARRVVEPDRFARERTPDAHPVLGPVARPFRRRLLIVALLALAVSVITGPANSLVFVYAQNFLHLSGIVTSGMVVAAGLAGLGGLLLGRWLADHMGRRPTVALAIAGMAVSGTIAYSGSSWALFVGYVAGVTAGAVFAPAGGALANELFPTQVRASVAGWYIGAGVVGAVGGLLAFGAVADVGRVGDHAGTAAAVIFLPMILATALLLLLPETKGREPEELWGASPIGPQGFADGVNASGAGETISTASPDGRSAREEVDAQPDPPEQDEQAQPPAATDQGGDHGRQAAHGPTSEPPAPGGGHG